MKLLHTSDWHVGKTLRGNSRVDEHRAVLAEHFNNASTAATDYLHGLSALGLGVPDGLDGESFWMTTVGCQRRFLPN